MGFRRSEVRILSPRLANGLWRIDLRHRPFYHALLYPFGLPLWEGRTMARQAKLRKKNGYWMTKAGGAETYFGKAADLPYADARRLFLDHLKAVADGRRPRRAALTAEVLCDRHLDWLRDNRSGDLYKQRQYLLSMWCD